VTLNGPSNEDGSPIENLAPLENRYQRVDLPQANPVSPAVADAPYTGPIAETFQELELVQALQDTLKGLGFDKPTPIQARSLPITLIGRDLVGIAQTGSGKTAAFVLPLLMRLLQEPDSNALILAPTRELAQQIETVIRQLTAKLPEMRFALLIGGTSMVPQLRNLKKTPRILIATPGRLVDHLRGKTANLKNTTMLVLDEADRMLDMGFIPQIEQILRYVPEARQTLLFSATWPKEIQQLSRRYLRDPVQVRIPSPQSTAPKITQNLVHTSSDRKRDTLLEELQKRPAQTIVFAKTQHRTDRVAHFLDKAGISVGLIHGGRSQGQRKRALDEFRAGKIQVLVATDIAARGLDIPEVGHVVNFDLPMVPEDYIHRIGRTARAGREGEALSIIAPEDRGLWRDIEKLLRARAQQS
jgi:superfamily II DNA/RNA helicase